MHSQPQEVLCSAAILNLSAACGHFKSWGDFYNRIGSRESEEQPKLEILFHTELMKGKDE